MQYCILVLSRFLTSTISCTSPRASLLTQRKLRLEAYQLAYNNNPSISTYCTMDGSSIKIVCNQNYNIDCDIHHTPLKFKCSLSTTLQNLRLAPRSSTCLHSCDRPFYHYE